MFKLWVIRHFSTSCILFAILLFSTLFLSRFYVFHFTNIRLLASISLCSLRPKGRGGVIHKTVT